MDFWEGQLKKAVLLSLGNVDVAQMANPFVEMGNPGEEESVAIVYVCTEERVFDVLGSLMRKDYFLDKTVLSDKTVFIYNSRNIEDLSERITRKECRGIIVNIVENLSQRERKRVEYYSARFITLSRSDVGAGFRVGKDFSIEFS